MVREILIYNFDFNNYVDCWIIKKKMLSYCDLVNYIEKIYHWEGFVKPDNGIVWNVNFNRQ